MASESSLGWNLVMGTLGVALVTTGILRDDYRLLGIKTLLSSR